MKRTSRPKVIKTTQKFIKALLRFTSFLFLVLFMQDREGVGDQLGREDREADRISQAVKTHMKESSGLKKGNKNAALILMLLCDLRNTSSLLEGELGTCEGRKYPNRALII